VGGTPKHDGAALSDLTGDLIAEILLRLSPENPGRCCKVASLVCKSWHRILSDPGFRRRYAEFHLEEIQRRLREEAKRVRNIS
jgi:hypothetical protein